MTNDLQRVLDLKPQVATLPLTAVKLKLTEDSQLAQINGLNAVISQDARRDIIKMAGLDQNSIQTIRNTAGEQAANQILSQAFKSLAGKNVSFAFDGPRITRVVDPKNRAVALKNTQVVQIVEMLVQKGLQIWGVQVSPDGTGANIQIVDPTIRNHPTMKDESVSIGRSLHWDALGGTSIHDFIQRMFCANGSTLNEDGRAIQALHPGMDPGSIMEVLFTKGAEKRVAKHFERIQKLQETQMSVHEWNLLLPWLKGFEKDAEVFQNHLGCMNPEKMGWQKEYQKKAIILNDLTAAQLRNAPTPINWWDALNTMTWLASHETNTEVDEWRKGQMLTQAGKWTCKNSFDSDAWLQGLPSFN